MKKILFGILVCIFSIGYCQGQKIFVCKNARISFYSSAPIEDIAAQTDSAVSSINLKTGAVYFKVPVRSFQFEKPLMQKHFNEHYLQSNLYPYAVFKGKIIDFIPPDSDGIYPVVVKGKLTIHGVTKADSASGSLELKAGELGVASAFKVRLKDYDIKIPRLLIKNIAEVVDVKVSAVYDLQEPIISTH